MALGHNLHILVAGATATVRRLLPHPNLGVLITPHCLSGLSIVRDTGCPWAADNAAFSRWDEAKYWRMLDRIHDLPNCLWVVVPDVVADARATLRRWRDWHQAVKQIGQPLAFVGQDGLTDDMVPWEQCRCYFVGGSTEWKQSQTSISFIATARERGKLVHIGRVNSRDRLLWAFEMGAHSIDGTSFSMFPDTYLPPALAELQGWECQRWLYV